MNVLQKAYIVTVLYVDECDNTCGSEADDRKKTNQWKKNNNNMRYDYDGVLFC